MLDEENCYVFVQNQMINEIQRMNKISIELKNIESKMTILVFWENGNALLSWKVHC